MIALVKPIARKTARPFMHYRTPVVASLEPGDILRLRLLRHRQSVVWNLHDLYYQGVRRDVALAKREKARLRHKKA